MTRQDLIIATIRTAVPGALGWLLAQLVALIPAVADVLAYVDGVLAATGIGATAAKLLEAAAIAGAIAAYYWVARKLGARFPVLERWLLGRSATPLYVDPAKGGIVPAVVTDLDGRLIEPAPDGIVTLQGESGPEVYIPLANPERNRAILDEAVRRLDEDDDEPRHRA